VNTLYTAGYQGWTVPQLERALESRGALLLDIRANPTTTRAEWRKAALAQRLGARYTHVPALGNRNYANGGPIALVAPHAALPLVAAALALGPVVLLCACRDWQTCHRRDAAAFLAERLGCAVEHLDPPARDLPEGAIPGLTLTQPYATLVAIGAKLIETRSWATPYRGRIAIHAGKGLGPVGGMAGLRALVRREPFASVLGAWGALTRTNVLEDPVRYLPRGVVIATAELAGCSPTVHHPSLPIAWRHVETERMWHLTEQEEAFGDYTPGRYAWLLADVRPLAEPVPAKGALGLWPWTWTPPEGVRL
jgi:hypothetical protein